MTYDKPDVHDPVTCHICICEGIECDCKEAHDE